MEQNNEERNENVNPNAEQIGENRAPRNNHRRDKYRGNRRPNPRGNNSDERNSDSRTAPLPDGNRQERNTPPQERQSNSPERRQHPNERDRNRFSEGRNEQRGEKPSGPSVSVVIPMLNEEESLPELIEQLEIVLEKATRGRYEVLFIDDGSTDGSFGIVRKYNKKNARIHGIRFRRNYGKSAALSVAFATAKNDVVITMDADLQDDPNEIPNLLAKIQEGYDLVSGWKKKRNDPLEKRLPSKFFNFITSTVSGIKLHDFNCGLKAYRRDVVKTVQVYGEMHRYIPALAHWEGFKVTELSVQHHARKYGYSKFGFSRYMKGFLDLLTVVFTTRFIKRPLHLFGTLGALFAIIGFSVDLYLSYEWAFHNVPLSNRPLTLAGVALIIVGVQLISMGLIGEMIVKNSLSNAEYTIKEKF